METTPAFAVRLDVALKARPFISKEETRYYPNGVFIEASPRGGATCVATDGHRMGIAYDADGLVHRSVITQIPAIIKREKGLFLRPWLVGVFTSQTNGYIAVVDGRETDDREDTAEFAIERVEDCSLRIGRMFIDGTFPDWRRVVPATNPTDVTRKFNRKHLSSFGDYIQVTGANETSPQIVQTDDKDFIGLLMPVRPDKREMPEWISVPKDKAA